jgi:enterochelin esterase-like enzyme
MKIPAVPSACVHCFLTVAFLILLAGAQAAETYTEAPGNQGDGSITNGPRFTVDAALTDKGTPDKGPQGQAFLLSLPTASSKIFRGTDPTLDLAKKPIRKDRKIFVYVPAAYKDGTKAPFLVILDGPAQIGMVHNALDNLTVSKDPERRLPADPERRLPAFIAIAVQSGGSDGPKSERSLEYDTLSDRFARFINDEVLPAVLGNPQVKAAYPHLAFTDNPWGRAVMGCDSGGAAALTMAWFRPDLFRRVIAYSGSFVAQQDEAAPEHAKYPLGSWEYHSEMKLIENSAPKPLRIFTQVSENDFGANDPEETHHNWVLAGKRTAAALDAKGYQHRFLFSLGAGHCEHHVFQESLGDTLVWLWRGYHGE